MMTQNTQYLTQRLFVSLLAGLAGLMASCGATGKEYPNTENFGIQVNKSDVWYERCMRVKDATPPDGDIPSKQLAITLSSCDPEDLYYDAKSESNPNEADWSKVRDCAFAKSDDPVLMMLYANGFGVKKTIELALKYACSAGGAPAEVQGRVDHLDSMIYGDNIRRSYNSQSFDICDDATSRQMEITCTNIRRRQKEKVINIRIDKLVSQWSPEQKSNFEKLRKSASDFMMRYSSQKTGDVGSGNIMLATEEFTSEMDSFLGDVENYEEGRLPSFTIDQFAKIDQQLNQIYKKQMHTRTGGGNENTGLQKTYQDNLRTIQRIWLEYRDAWVIFGHSRYPSVEPQSWKAMLTEERIKQLTEPQKNTDDN